MISAFCFFKDEEKYLQFTAASWAPFVDELVLMDTGSSDNSMDVAIEKARESNPMLSIIAGSMPWRPNDWGAITTEVAELCTQPWVLRMDADEMLSGHAGLFRRLVEQQELYDMGLARQFLIDMQEPETSPEGETILKSVCYRSRLQRWSDGWEYRYLIDPVATPTDGRDQHIMSIFQPYIAAALHMRLSVRPESLERAHFFKQYLLDHPELDEVERRHYQEAIDRAAACGGKENPCG